MPKKIDKKDEQIKNLTEQLARALADYDNFRKRTAERAEQERFLITGRVVTRFLPVLDMLYEAQKHLNDGGLALTIKEFEDTLKLEGIEAINPKVGDKFDVELHEAVEIVDYSDRLDSQGESGEVIAETVMRGWKFMDGQVIRHAKVKVNQTGT